MRELNGGGHFEWRSGPSQHPSQVRGMNSLIRLNSDLARLTSFLYLYPLIIKYFYQWKGK